ncbi:MAG: tail fiber domain-containing protein [Bdellovibrionales bacterium]
MQRRIYRRIQGFTLIEMAVVMAVVGVLIAGLWNLISGANQQSRDNSAATQQSQLISSVKQYLISPQGQDYMNSNTVSCGGACAANANFALPLPSSAACSNFADTNWREFCKYLPAGFIDSTVNSYGQTYSIRILRDALAGQPPSTYSFMILTQGGTQIPDTSGGRISALIGSDGGFIYDAHVCTAAPASSLTMACGSYGGWSAQITGAGPTGYGFTAPAAGGLIASRTYVSPEQNSLSNWLARVVMPGDTAQYSLNTMQTPAYMGTRALVMGSYLGGTPDGSSAVAGTKSIYMGDYNNGSTGTGGTVHVQGGQVNLEGGTLDFGNGTLTGSANTVDGGVTITLPSPAVSTDAGITLSGDMIGPGATTPNAILSIVGNCSYATGAPNYVDPATTRCGSATRVTGDVDVAGLLNAYNLFAGSFIYRSSDIRLKTDIHPLHDPLSDIMKIKPVAFKFKSNGEESMGVIAQEIEKIYPQLVQVKDDIKYVDYEGLIGPLVGAVQELKKENDQLRDELRQQRVRQEALIKKLEIRDAR